jgi:hypothetical protein
VLNGFYNYYAVPTDFRSLNALVRRSGAPCTESTDAR